jgi:predicted membrane protein
VLCQAIYTSLLLKKKQMQDQQLERRPGFRNNNRWGGLIFLLVGGVLLLRQTGYPFPSWLFTWEMILIVLGLFIGIRHRFKDFSWLLLILIGLVFLSDDIWPGFRLRQFAVPIIIIALGLIFILSPRRMCGGRGRFRRYKERFTETLPAEAVPHPDSEPSNETAIDVVSIFGGIKKRVLSKQFTGGDIVCVFGGAEVNLSNADFISPIILDLTLVFGGTKLIVPPNWEVRSEVAAIFGGVDDKRPQIPTGVPEKTIILKGTLMFAGVEINSFIA